MLTVTRGAAERAERDDTLGLLFQAHYRSLVRLASLLLDDVPSCEEVVQDAFARYHTLTSPPAPDKAPAYLRSMVLNGARSRMRKRRTRRLRIVNAPPPIPSAESAAVKREEHRRMLLALRALPRRQSEVLTLRYYLELSEAEIAETLDISAGSVKTHASRGLAALARKLESPDD